MPKNKAIQNFKGANRIRKDLVIVANETAELLNPYQKKIVKGSFLYQQIRDNGKNSWLSYNDICYIIGILKNRKVITPSPELPIGVCDKNQFYKVNI
jgi:hypothetical protein